MRKRYPWLSLRLPRYETIVSVALHLVSLGTYSLENSKRVRVRFQLGLRLESRQVSCLRCSTTKTTGGHGVQR